MLKHIILLLILSFVLQAQQFDGDRVYYYTVKSSEYEEVGHLALLNSAERRPSIYTSKWRFDAKKNTKLISDQEIPIMHTDSSVILEMPNSGYLSDLGKVPYPQLNFSMEGGDSIFVKQSYVEYREDYLHDTINTKGYVKLVDYHESFINDKVVKTWTLEANNLDNPDYRAIYTYSSNYGFVNFKYFLADKEIEINHFRTYHILTVMEE